MTRSRTVYHSDGSKSEVRPNCSEKGASGSSLSGKVLGCLFVSVVGIVLLGNLAAGLFLTIWGISETAHGLASRDWPAVEGKVVSAEIVSGEDDSYLARIVYAYTVNGKSFQGERQRFDGGSSYGGDRHQVGRYLDKYPVEEPTLIRYDPRHPERSVLEPGYHHSALVLLGAGVIFIVVPGGMALIVVRAWRRAARAR
jgi:hypothetical protein